MPQGRTGWKSGAWLGCTRPALADAPFLLVLVLLAMALTFPWGTVPASAAVPATAGRAEITEAGSTAALDAGGSATEFGVLLPAGAKCPGDTAHDGYHVFSYLVPKGVSPAQVSFKGIVPSEYYGYTALDEYYYGGLNTAPDTGLVLDLPSFFVLSRLVPSQLFSAGATHAEWDGGIACTNDHGVVTNYWNTEFAFTVTSKDPGGFTWTVVDPARVPVDNGTGLPAWLALVLAGCALVAAGVVFRIGQRHGKAARESGRP